MITNHRVVLPHPADSSVNLVLTDLDGQLVDESDGTPQTQADIHLALEYFEGLGQNTFATAIAFLQQFLDVTPTES